MYDNFSRKIQEVTRKQIPLQLDGELAVFSNTDRRNHPTIIKVTNITVKYIHASNQMRYMLQNITIQYKYIIIILQIQMTEHTC